MSIYRARAGARVACGGMVLLILGAVFSTVGGTSKTFPLTGGGPPVRAAGWEFAYEGRESSGHGRETFRLVAKRGATEARTPLSVEFSERGPVRKPCVLRSVLGCVYISLVDSGDVVLTPTATATHEGWISPPYKIPGAGGSVLLLGTQVESDMARMRYMPARGKPVDFDVAKGRPAVVDGITFEFLRLVVNSSGDMSSIMAGADLLVSGRGVRDRVVVEVNTKPFISLVWLGCALILVGGVMVFAGRRGENGILPNSN